MKRIPYILLALLLVPAVASATAYLSATCDGTDVTVSLSVFNDMGEEYAGRPIAIRVTEVGTCAASVEVEVPGLVVPGWLTELQTSFPLTAPQTDLFYTYTALVVMPDESLQQLFPAFAAAGCGEGAAAGRGFLTPDSPYLLFTSCGGPCWETYLTSGVPIDQTQLAPEDYEWAVGTGVAVELYGIGLGGVTMPGSGALVLTGLQAVPEGECASVDEAGLSWGSLKARYR